MNSRNYDNVPPLASNTVTIATSTTSQIRMAPAGQSRSIASVPMRQPVPIRKIIHDSGTSASGNVSSAQYSISHQAKEETDSQDYQSASTSSGPLIGPTANSFQQYQRGAPSGPSGSTVTSGALVANNGINSMAMDQPAPVNLASKVAEVFLTAGHAFQKLGDLTLQLHTTTDADESKWSEKEVDNLKNALTRFAHELDQISTCVASRTTKHIKNDIKRRHLISEDPPQQVKRMAMSAGGGITTGTGSYTTINSSGMIASGHAVPLGQKRPGGPPINKMIATRAVIPTTRYTVNTIPSSSFIPSSTVVVNSSQLPSPVGMPQLQSQGGSALPGSNVSQPQQQQRILTATTSTASMPRVTAPQQVLQGGVKSGGGTAKRIITPTSGVISHPTSGALILEQNN